VCRGCVEGHPARCELFAVKNFNGSAGDARDTNGEPVTTGFMGQSSFADRALVHERSIIVIDDDVPLELVGPLGCGVLTGAGAVLTATNVGVGSSVAVFGAGAVGLSAVMAAHLAGAERIIAVDLHDSRLELALELGATEVHVGGETVARQIVKTGGPVDFTFETTGVPAVVADAVKVLRAGGVCGLIGLPTGPSAVDTWSLLGNRTVTGLLMGDADPQRLIPTLLRFWRNGRFPFDRLIRSFPLSEIAEAERLSRSGDVIKPVLIPGH
jgi:aryl-alcohol dehydrogenase